jgi:hypothetical protein
MDWYSVVTPVIVGLWFLSSPMSPGFYPVILNHGLEGARDTISERRYQGADMYSATDREG